MIPAKEALLRLVEGNQRFVAGVVERSRVSHAQLDTSLLSEQKPFAVILGCSDSRVPIEILFDQGPGDLFVIRVAGNVAGLSQAGSIEFAVHQFETRLVVVLGHSGCGAVMATLLDELEPSGQPSPAIQAIVDHIRPGLQPLLRTELKNNPDELVRQAIGANVRATVDQLLGSPILQDEVRDGGLVIVGAEYTLETGVVTFFDDVP